MDSNILRNETNLRAILEQWLPKTGNWSICWRATSSGWSALKFHTGCDGKVPTLTIVKVVTKDKKNLIFGGYATRTWKGSKFQLLYRYGIYRCIL